MSKHSSFSIAQLAVAATLALGLVAGAQAQTASREAQGSKALAAKAALQKRQPVGLLTGKVNPLPRTLRDGTVALELDDSTLMYSVVRRNADGSTDMYCVSGPDAADRALNAPQQAVAQTKHQEHKYEEQ